MRSYQLAWMGAAVLAASVFGGGCSSHKGDQDGLGAVSVTANALTYTDIDHVTANVTGANITTPMTVPLGKKNASNDWKATVNGIPAGSATVSATAYKADGTVAFQGQINSAITANNTATVNITMFEYQPSVFHNSAPVISAIQVSSKTVEPSASISVGVVATDPDGDALTYLWTSNCGGAFDHATAASGSFQAPATAGACILTVKVTDTHKATNTATVQISVQAANKGNASITATPDLVPTVAGIDLTVTDSSGVDAAFVAPNVAHLAVSASDDLTPAASLVYAWQASSECTGSFSSTSVYNPTFTLSATSGTCTFTVTVTDQMAGSNSATLTVPVQAAAGTDAVAPVVDFYSQSGTDAYAGQALYFFETASQSQGHAISTVWTNSVDSNGTATPSNGGFSSTYVWTPPAGVSDGTAITVTVTVTDAVNHLTTSHVFNLTAASDQCASKGDGESCTGTNLCFGTYTCQSHVCVGSAPVACDNPPACMGNGACNPANGQCVYQSSPNGVACSDSKTCTGTSGSPDHCDGAGACISGAVNCPAATGQCYTAGTCNAAGDCEAQSPKPATATCDDGKACTGTAGSPDHCDGAGVCASGAVNCAAASGQCFTGGTCQTDGTCSTPAPRTGESCTIADLCRINPMCTASGECVGSDKCVAPLTCDPATGDCIPQPAAGACMEPQAGRDWEVATVNGFTTDGDGAPYVAGSFYGTNASPKSFGGTNIGNGAGSNVYAAKLNQDGSTAWAKSWGDDGDQVGIGMAASSTNVAIIGNYMGVLGSGAAGTTSIGLPANTSLTSTLDFVVGLSSATGDVTWTKKIDMGGIGMATIYSNPSLSDYYLCGSSSIATTDLDSTLTFGGTAGDGTLDIVVAKVHADGTIAWAKQFGGAGNQSCASIVADGTNVYIAGTYQGALNFGCVAPNPACGFANVNNPTRALLWVAKLADSNGAPQIAKTWGTSGAQYVRNITLDPQGNLYLAGGLNAAITFTGLPALTNNGEDALAVKLDSSLTPVWAKNWATTGTQELDSIATDSAGHLFVSGYFMGSFDASGTQPAISAHGALTDILTMKLDPANGDVLCMAGYGDAGGDGSSAIVVNRFASTASGNKDKAWISGMLAGSVQLSSSLTLTTPSTNVAYGYAVRIDPNSF